MDPSASVTRTIIAEGSPGSDRHLIPLVEWLIARGHRPLVNQRDHGFFYLANARRCWLGRRITLEEWQLITEQFVLPNSIVHHPGMICDRSAGVWIVGWNRVILDDGIHPVAVWEERGWPEIEAEPDPERTNEAAIEALIEAEVARDPRVRFAEFLAPEEYSPIGRLARLIGLMLFGALSFCALPWSLPIFFPFFLAILAGPAFPSAVLRILGRGAETASAELTSSVSESEDNYDTWINVDDPSLDDDRQVIAGGTVDDPLADPPIRPLVQFLIERGHQLFREDQPGPDEWGVYRLTRILTPADWRAIDERFVVPRNIEYLDGRISDRVNGHAIVGCDEVARNDDWLACIEIWEDRAPLAPKTTPPV